MLANHWSSLSAPQAACSTWTGNYADNQTCAPHVCCGWMDLHDDIGYGVTADQPDFIIEPLYWDEEAVLVVTDEDQQFRMVERTPLPVRFNGTRPHGLVPRLVAEELVQRQDEAGPLYRLFLAMAGQAQTRPKLVWKWLPVPEYETVDIDNNSK